MTYDFASKKLFTNNLTQFCTDRIYESISKAWCTRHVIEKNVADHYFVAPRLQILPGKSACRTKVFGEKLTVRQTPLLGRQNLPTYYQAALTARVPFLAA